MTGGRGGNDFDVFNLSRRNLLQRLRAAEDARFAVYVHQKTAAASKRDIALGIDANRRRILQYVHRRAAVGQQIA